MYTVHESSYRPTGHFYCLQFCCQILDYHPLTSLTGIEEAPDIIPVNEQCTVGGGYGREEIVTSDKQLASSGEVSLSEVVATKSVTDLEDGDTVVFNYYVPVT